MASSFAETVSDLKFFLRLHTIGITPEAFVYREGGYWQPWRAGRIRGTQLLAPDRKIDEEDGRLVFLGARYIHAFRCEDRVWDAVNGWRYGNGKVPGSRRSK